MKNIIVKKKHSKECFMEESGKEYYFPSGKMFFGNFRGNESLRGNSHYWIEMQCNDPLCQFRAIINSGSLSDLLKKEICPKKK